MKILDPKEWIIFRSAHKELHHGRFSVTFENDSIPRYVDSDILFTIQSLLDVEILQSEYDANEECISIAIDEVAFNKINDLKSLYPKAGLGVFIMNRPFSLIQSIQSLNTPLIHWCGEDRVGIVLISELINSYKLLSNKDEN